MLQSLRTQQSRSFHYVMFNISFSIDISLSFTHTLFKFHCLRSCNDFIPCSLVSHIYTKNQHYNQSFRDVQHLSMDLISAKYSSTLQD
jgi:hypothetical protein